jgi:hypothetical protein
MLAWASNEGAFPKRGYDGSLRSLAHHFQADEDSPYRQMKWNSQANFDKTVKLIGPRLATVRLVSCWDPTFCGGTEIGVLRQPRGDHRVLGALSTAWMLYAGWSRTA